MVNAFPPDRTDQPFGIGILPRRSPRGRSISDAHRPNTSGEYLAIGTIPVVDQVLWSPFPAACLSELTSDPLGGRVRGGPQPQDLAPIVAQDEQAIQKPERNRRHHEKIHRDDPVRMVAQKGRPALGWRSPPSHHVFGYTRLPDIDAELEQLAVDPRCTP